jgi:hypothetical protein
MGTPLPRFSVMSLGKMRFCGDRHGSGHGQRFEGLVAADTMSGFTHVFRQDTESTRGAVVSPAGSQTGVSAMARVLTLLRSKTGSTHLDLSHLGVLAAPPEQPWRLHPEVAHLAAGQGSDHSV